MKTIVFTIIFIIIVTLELIFGSFESYTTWHYFTKPAIVISLMLFFILNADHLHLTIKITTILALLFSLFGDCLLMFVSNDEGFFMAGLVSFLIAHIMYILVFLRDCNGKKAAALPLIVLLLVYATGLFWYIKDGLGDLLIPVLVYMTVILTMAITAYLRKGMVLPQGFTFVFIGAVFFMLSDSLLAINKFYEALPYSNLSIMATYAAAQFLIVSGIIKSYQK
ncbi:putative membrane protein YhhN [Kordia periserrulae]|uniref:Putative membrane protein YhhN n=1 Tax=Kordia periserrulae TaxID=701523 RepID=A0A2T6C157_9FLAO|nr:lysoplasmalogenase [Kordia periserrulae]PTX62050.1 putative membrane protein YhhN [Kordia periserrulae]